METPMVSVVMITYGHEKYIEEAINGVLMQDCNFDVELIVANDCSPDNTDVVIQKIIKNHQKSSWIKYIKHEKNIGMMPNFVYTLKEAKGKYIALCEGDDYWIDPLKLQKQVDFLEENEDYSMSFTDANIIIESNLNRGMDELKLENRDYEGIELLDRWIVPTASVVFKNTLTKEDFKNLGKKNILAGDILLFLILCKYGKVRCLNQITCVYRRNSGGVSTQSNQNFKPSIIHFEELKAIFPQKYDIIINNHLSKVCLNGFLLNLKKIKPVTFYFLFKLLVISPGAIPTYIIKNKLFNTK